MHTGPLRQLLTVRLRNRRREWVAAAIVSGAALLAALLAQPPTIQMLENITGS